jgi:hypothetical protein
MRTFFGAIAVVLAASVSLAHHGLVMYDTAKPITLKGTFARMDWVNAHGFIYLEVAGRDGEPVTWPIETGSPGALTGHGWARGDLPIGKVVVVEGFLARDGSSKAVCNRVTFPDGRTRGCGGHAPGSTGR